VISKIKKIFLSVVILGMLLSLVVKAVNSQENDSRKYFDTSSETTYQVFNDAKTLVLQKIAITNKEEYTYAPSYVITLNLDSISDIKVSSPKGPIPYTVSEKGNNKIINIEFPEKILGKGNKNEFSFSYISSDYATKTGSIFRVYIPPVSNLTSFNSYVVYVSVPENLEKPFLIKPQVDYTENNNFYSFPTATLADGVTMFFGSSQYYDFKLSYHLENKNLYPIETEIAIPPDTSYQEIVLKNVNPDPTSSYMDKDKNILFRYRLAPKSFLDVQVNVMVRISDAPIEESLPASLRDTYLRQQKYWEVNDPQIKKLAQELRTPERIYEYVVKSLSYDDSKTGDGNERLGAKNVLKKPYFAVCLEFTDLFIAIARASGIPARAVEGYAYTRDDKNKPLSLYQDVLHAWPEYYNEEKKTWVYVDPTWGNTTHGTDFFHQLDFDHVAFTINGQDSTYPVPAGGYKGDKESKDVVFEFGNPDEFKKIKKLVIGSDFSSFAENGKINGVLSLKNKGNYVAKDYKALLLVDGKEKIDVSFPASPPYGESTVFVSISSSLTKPLHNIKIFDEEGVIVFDKNIFVFPFSQYVLVGGALFFGAIIVFIIAFKTRRVSVQKQRERNNLRGEGKRPQEKG
jgi:hypothetical protein